MLLSTKRLQGERARARDGDAGRIEDVYFEDAHWQVRYVVVEQEARMRRLFREEQLSLEEYREQRADMAAERERLQARLQQAAAAAAEAEAALAGLQRAEEMAGHIAAIRSLPVEQQKHLLRHFAQSVTLRKNPDDDEVACEIVWKWNGTRAPEAG
jgi:transcription elongation GreA/GreB family factor